MTVPLRDYPALGDILPGLPPALKARLLAAFGLEILWNKPGRQVTVFAEITEATLQAIPGLTDPGQDGYHDTSPQTSDDDAVLMGHLNNTPRSGGTPQPVNPSVPYGSNVRFEAERCGGWARAGLRRPDSG